MGMRLVVVVICSLAVGCGSGSTGGSEVEDVGMDTTFADGSDLSDTDDSADTGTLDVAVADTDTADVDPADTDMPDIDVIDTPEPTVCSDGFVESGGVCVDADECEDNNGDCEQTCLNTEGSFVCACEPPSTLAADGKACDGVCDDLGRHYVSQTDPPSAPPYSGTVWYSPDIIRSSDPTAFVDLTYDGQGSRVMFDRRSASFVTLNPHLFTTHFGTSVQIEIQVNPEFSVSEAEIEARKYAAPLGRLPAFLFADLETVWIHRGNEAFGGGNNNLLIHVARGDEHFADSSIEEVMIHELTHTSLDSHHASQPLWLAAQTADGVAISTYARDYPNREDLSETVGPYLAIRFRSERLSVELAASITDTIPNRIKYLDCLDLSMDIVP